MESFLRQLFETGEITVPRDASSLENAAELLSERDRLVRLNCPGIAPPYDPNVAMKAARTLLLFCQAAVYRDMDAAAVRAQLNSIALSAVDTPSCHYSADLMLQFLPDVRTRLVRISQDDPVCELLQAVAIMWPLSSVGIPGSLPETLPVSITTAPLLQVYVDRIIARRANDRLPEITPSEVADAAVMSTTELSSGWLVRECIRAALGEFPHLAPEWHSGKF